MEFIVRAFNKQDLVFGAIIKEIRESDIVGKELKGERRWIVKKMLGLVEISGGHDENSREAREFLEKLIQYIQKSPRTFPDVNNIKHLLFVFRQMFDHIKDTTKEKEIPKKLENLRERLHELKVTRMILQLICSKHSPLTDKLFPSLLALANNLLEDAPKHIQDEFYNYFINHKNSENLFEQMEKKIQKNIYKVTKNPERFMRTGTIGSEWIDIQLEILLFLKGLCEGHHSGHQYFLGEQKTNRTNYDMITILVEYAKALQPNVTTNYLAFVHLSKTLIALTETVQVIIIYIYIYIYRDQ